MVVDLRVPKTNHPPLPTLPLFMEGKISLELYEVFGNVPQSQNVTVLYRTVTDNADVC